MPNLVAPATIKSKACSAVRIPPEALIAEICEAADQNVKVILETNLLTDTEKSVAAEIAMDAGASFLKTCTGWNGGATVTDVRLLKEVARERVGRS